MTQSTGALETVDFLLSKAARLDKALKSLPKTDRKTLHTSSHKRARRLLRNLSFPAKASELTAENIEHRIDVLTAVKSSAVSFAKKMPPLTDALTVGPDAIAVRACALEAREGLAEDLCTEEISKTGASLQYVDAEGLLNEPSAQPWPSMEHFSHFYETPPHLRLPPRPGAVDLGPAALPARPTIGGLEEAKAIGKFPNLLPALVTSAVLGSEPPPEPPPSKRPSKNIFHSTAAYRNACHRMKVTPLETLPIFGEMVEVVGADLDETRHAYALAEGVRASTPVGLRVENCYMTDMGASTVIEAAFAGERLQSLSLSGIALSYRSALAIYGALRRSCLGHSLRSLSLAGCGLGCDLELTLPQSAQPAYLKCRGLLERTCGDEEVLAKQGDVAGLISEHLQATQPKAAANMAGDDLSPSASAPSAPSPAPEVASEAAEAEEAEEPLVSPVLLPVFSQLMQSHVTTLNLSQSWLSPSSVTALSNSLPSTQIEIIKLEECGLDDAALQELSLRGILRSKHLLEVSLRRNRFSGHAAAITTIFQAVRVHARIAHLDLAENLMRPECIDELYHLLGRSVSLMCLHLLGCEDSCVEDTSVIQAACYKWTAEIGATGLEGEEIQIPEPAQGEEHSELILCRAPHLDAKDWIVATPPPNFEVGAKKFTAGCWIAEAKQNPRFQIPEGVPETGAPEEEIEDWSQGPARIKALMDCFEEDIKIIYLKDVCHVDDEEAVKDALRSKYDLYYECYALVAGRSQWPFVRYVDMYNVFDDVRVVERSGFGRKKPERRHLHMQDIHIMVTQTMANHSEEANAAASSAEGVPVTRPQFFEVMLRAAISWGEDLAAGAAIRAFADEIVAGRLLQPPLAPFPRGVPLRPGEYSDALQAFGKTLREAWERFGYSSVAFQRLAQLVRLCDRDFTSKNVASIYALAKQPQADYRASTAGEARGLSYPEFCEAVGRLAMVWSRSSWMPACCPKEDGSMRGRRWPPQPQANRPVKEHVLVKRLEAFVKRLAERMKPSVRARASFL